MAWHQFWKPKQSKKPWPLGRLGPFGCLTCPRLGRHLSGVRILRPPHNGGRAGPRDTPLPKAWTETMPLDSSGGEPTLAALCTTKLDNYPGGGK